MTRVFTTGLVRCVQALGPFPEIRCLLKHVSASDSVSSHTLSVAMRNVLTSLGNRDLVECIRCGETTAENEFVRRYSNPLRLMMLARTRNLEDAEDLAQDTLLAVIQALRHGNMRSHDRLSSFVHSVAQNVVNNHIRACRRMPLKVLLSEDLPAAPVESRLESEERLALALNALTGERVLDRTILRMSLVEGLTPFEIGEKLHMLPEVVRTRKCRAAHRLVAAIDAL